MARPRERFDTYVEEPFSGISVQGLDEALHVSWKDNVMRVGSFILRQTNLRISFSPFSTVMCMTIVLEAPDQTIQSPMERMREQTFLEKICTVECPISFKTIQNNY
jgi:hypothetical protein